MSIQLRILLIIGSVATLIYFLLKIRKSKLRIEDGVFWIIFSFVMILLSLLPDVVSYAAELLGVISPVNFLFLAIIFVLLMRIFSLTLKISQLSSKLESFVQIYAIDNKKSGGDNSDNEDNSEKLSE